jgi:putative ABC transport system permease protein
VPLVRAATLTSRAPVQLGRFLPVRVDPGSPRDVNMRFRSVQPDYFDLLGVTIRRGRRFDGRDRAGAPQVAIINESAARLFADGVDPLGRAITVSFAGMATTSDRNAVTLEIIGVARDVRELLSRPARPELFVPMAQRPPDADRGTLLIFTEARAAALERAIKAAIWRVDPALPITNVEDFELTLSQQAAWMRFRAILIGAFAAAGLVLAAAGIWAVVAFSIVRRTREIGIRVAFGAPASRVIGLMLAQVGRPIAVGAFVGLIGTFNLSRLLEAWVYEVEAGDPAVLGIVVAGLVLFALPAAAIPARRALRLEPAVTLRKE